MRTIRRLYVYLVAFISLEVVVWGLIGLIRSIAGGDFIGSKANQLASAISLTAVGVPVFLLHWWLAQRTIDNDEERFARLRTFFLYGALLATLIPIVQNILALVNRAWLQVFKLPSRLAFVGEGQTWLDNSIAIVVNALIAAYIFRVLQKDWGIFLGKSSSHGKTFFESRRLYRYVWGIYGLAMVVGGIQQVLYFILNLGETVGQVKGASLANGLALLVAGVPLWIYAWGIVQKSLTKVDERRATLRFVILYVLSLIGVGGVLFPAGIILSVVFRLILGEAMDLGHFINELSGPLSAGIPFGAVWFYFGRLLTGEIAALPDTPQRSGLRRIYYYILSIIGLVTLFFGLHSLLSFIIDTILQTAAWGDTLRERLALSIATLTVGLPLWFVTWRSMVIESAQKGEAGDHARRSLVRKVYLYLVLFAGVIGVMVSAGSLIFQLLSKLLGDPTPNFQRASWMLLELLVLFAAWLIYHFATLRSDGRMAEQSLAARHESFPVLVLVSESGEFSEEIIKFLQQEVPSLPVAVHSTEKGVPDDAISEAKAVILPGNLSANPTESIRLWLQDFAGIRLVVPTRTDGWLWVFGSNRHLSGMARQTAKTIRYLAEGEEIPTLRETSPWTIFVYVIAGIVGIPVLIGLFSALGEILY